MPEYLDQCTEEFPRTIFFANTIIHDNQVLYLNTSGTSQI